MSAASTEQPLRRRIRSRGAVLLLVAVLLIAALPFSSWWWGPRVEVWQVARGFVEAVRDGDCGSAASLSTITPSALGCSAHSYGLPDELAGYSVSVDWLNLDRNAFIYESARGPETAVGLKIPGYQGDYGLAMSQRGGSWVVTDVIVLL